MRLGIFGGSFDPIHNGHLLLAECCREQLRLDAVWFVPAATPPHKQNREMSAAERRIEMIELAIAGNPAFAANRYEIERGGVNYTVDTLSHFSEEDPRREMFFLLGADMLRDLPHWRNAARVCELALPAAVRRPGAGELDFDCLRDVAAAERIDQMRRCVVEMPEIGISGQEIRQRVQSGESIRYQTPLAVEAYIQSHGLYRPIRTGI
jgi:nicotinate-nucleotide adenylyltransferase